MKIEVDHPQARALFQRWLDRGDAVGVFTNQALDSFNAGHRVFIPLSPDEAVESNLHKMHAPDGSYGLGWKYLLTNIERSLEAFEFTSK